jgi:hypothetical protein
MFVSQLFDNGAAPDTLPKSQKNGPAACAVGADLSG